MDKSRVDENKVLAYLRKLGLNPIRYSKKEMRKTGNKTPEFMVKKDDELLFYCEVKSIMDDGWENGLRPDPICNQIQKKIHEAVKQFGSVNQNHAFPNVLVFKNNQYGIDVTYLQSVLTGMFFADNGMKYPIYKKYSHGRIKNEKFFIDLYIWYQSFKWPFKNLHL